MSTAKQHFKAGESHGQSQATPEEWMQSTKDAANATKDKAADATQSATESGQATAEEWMQSTKDAANATKDKTADATQSATESAQHGRDQSASFIQQKGEQMKHMAQGVVDSVKSTLGVGDK